MRKFMIHEVTVTFLHLFYNLPVVLRLQLGTSPLLKLLILVVGKVFDEDSLALFMVRIYPIELVVNVSSVKLAVLGLAATRKHLIIGRSEDIVSLYMQSIRQLQLSVLRNSFASKLYVPDIRVECLVVDQR